MPTGSTELHCERIRFSRLLGGRRQVLETRVLEIIGVARAFLLLLAGGFHRLCGAADRRIGATLRSLIEV